MLQKLLVKVDELKASDLYISVGLPATIKLNGRLESLTKKDLNNEEVFSLLKEAMGESRFADFQQTKEANYAVNSDEAGRFRISAFMQKEEPGMVIRRIEGNI
ncbi:MAG: type IV pili twitching motility protein PilT, partial [Psychromonas sp.]|nr:type IV pili twitching motility protein PilT [Psychromonas sp.]